MNKPFFLTLASLHWYNISSSIYGLWRGISEYFIWPEINFHVTKRKHLYSTLNILNYQSGKIEDEVYICFRKRYRWKPWLSWVKTSQAPAKRKFRGEKTPFSAKSPISCLRPSSYNHFFIVLCLFCWDIYNVPIQTTSLGVSAWAGQPGNGSSQKRSNFICCLKYFGRNTLSMHGKRLVNCPRCLW